MRNSESEMVVLESWSSICDEDDYYISDSTKALNVLCKGAPARESRTGTRLVSPATGCQKKKKTTLEQGLRTQN